MRPDYRRIYMDLISKEHPDKMQLFKELFVEEDISNLDIIKINSIIFNAQEKITKEFNIRHRSYDKSSIFQILEYQKKNKLNNTQLANHFKLSRNTITKWKKHLSIK